jgi:hypothetical protein
MRTHSRLLALAAFTSCLALTSACNKRVFQFIEPSCDRTIPLDISIPLQRDADILIVVDNSGSMAEEQQKLADNFINLRCGDPDDDSTCECPLRNLAAVPDEFKNPQPALYEGDGPLSKCGFIQLLAAFETDFRVGVITTDVGPCDNRFGSLGDEFRPQRGCLQPDGPSRANARLLISRADLDDLDEDNDDLAARFSATLAHIGTRGTGFERGLDAAEIFLSADADRAPECSDDLATFRRDGAQLVTIFLTDEEDCSHADGAFGFLDEGDGLTCGANDSDPFTQRVEPARCYPEDGQSQAEGLAPIARYVDALRGADPDVKVAVIAGIVDDGDEQVAASCRAADSPSAPPALDCFESHGSSNNPDQCGPTAVAARDGLECCIADRGDRYVELANAIAAGSASRTSLLDSICEQSFRQTMIDIAALVGSTNFVDLVEPPAGGVLVVTTVKAGQTEEQVVPRLNTAAQCEEEDGFLLTGNRVLFCNDAVPSPGDDVFIRAKGEANTPQCDAAE